MDGSSDGDAADLREVILAQSAQGIAVPVLLFGPASDPASEPGSEPGSEHGSDPASAPTDPDRGASALDLSVLAGELGVDLDSVDLSSPEGYLLQCAAGQRLLDRELDQR